jgi:hypothetical protein
VGLFERVVVGVGVEAVGDGATGLKLGPLVAAGPGLAAVIATPMTIGTTVIRAATSARTAGHLRLRPAPAGDGLDVEVIFLPLRNCFVEGRPALAGCLLLDQR